MEPSWIHLYTAASPLFLMQSIHCLQEHLLMDLVHTPPQRYTVSWTKAMFYLTVSWMPLGKQRRTQALEVLPPPSELQSDAWKYTAGRVAGTPATRPGVNTPPSHSEENKCKLACSTQSGDSAAQMHISLSATKQTMKTRSPWDAGWSGGRADDYDDAEIISWHSDRARSDRRPQWSAWQAWRKMGHFNP